MTSEERIDELEKKVRIMAMANDNLRESVQTICLHNWRLLKTH